MSLSKIMLIGRLTKDPELKTINVKGQDTSLATFGLAVDNDFNDGVEFFNVTVWRKQAENVARFTQKGKLVYVEGRLQSHTYTPEGSDREVRVWDVNASTVQFLSPKNEAPQDPVSSAPTGRTQSAASYDPFGPGGTVDIKDEDLPF